MSFTIHHFEINPSEDSVGYAFTEEVQEGQKLYFLGRFPASTPDVASIAEGLFSQVLEHLKTSQKEKPYDQFEEALKAANAYVQSLDIGAPDTIIAFFDFHHLYLSQSGQAESYLLREHSLSQISEASEDNGDVYLNILSGEINVHDTIILTSERLLRSLTSNQVLHFFTGEDFGKSCQDLQDALEAQPDQSYMIVSCIGVGKKEASPVKGLFSRIKLRKPSKGAPKVPPATEASASAEDPDPSSVAVEEPLPAEVAAPAPASPTKKLPNQALRRVLPIAAVVFVAFVVIVGIRALLNYESEEEQSLRASMDIAREALQLADAKLVEGARKEAQEYLEKAEDAVALVAKSKSQLFRSDVGFVLAQIDEKKLQVENAHKVTPTLVTDLSVKSDNVEALNLLGLRGNFYVNDSRKVYKTVRNIVENGLPLSDKETIVAGASRPDQNTLVYLSDSSRIIEYRENVINPMNTADDTWKQGIDIETYGRYVYLLDPVENQIWKYERRRSNYSSAAAYNNGVDLSRAVSFSIDGSIFVLTDDGNIKKLFRGSQVDYSFRDLPSTPMAGKNLNLYTSANLDALYILDPDNQRILVFSKGDRFANYKKQVLYGLPDARDFVIDESGQKVHLLTTDKIYTFSL